MPGARRRCEHRAMRSADRRTEILLTVDVEFSIAGALTHPGIHAPLWDEPVHGRVDGRSEGLGFVLETLAASGLPATFFVEALNHRYFGDAPMASVCRQVAAAGQDIQLHLHPVWTCFEGGRRAVGAVDDDCAGRGQAAMEALLREGMASFARWGVAPPVALRTGGLSVDGAVHAAMRAVGMRLSSSVGVAIAMPGEPALRLATGRRRFGDVIEAPVTCFADWRLPGRRHLRPLQVSACSAREATCVLDAARRAGIGTLVLLTHPFEYVKADGFRYARMRPNRVNQERLRAICAHVAAHPGAFEAIDFATAATRLPARPDEAPRELRGSAALALLRMGENALNDRVWAM